MQFSLNKAQHSPRKSTRNSAVAFGVHEVFFGSFSACETIAQFYSTAIKCNDRQLVDRVRTLAQSNSAGTNKEPAKRRHQDAMNIATTPSTTIGLILW